MVTYKIYTLCAQKEEFHEPAGFAHFQKGQEVHPLVVRLLEQRLDPTIVALQRPYRAQMAEHARHHTRDTGNGFEKDEPDELSLTQSC